MSYENRDDTLPRAESVLEYYKCTLERKLLEQVRAAFKASWSKIEQFETALDFTVEIWFDCVIPEYILKAISSELVTHGWTNHVLMLKAKNPGDTMHHYLMAKLDHIKACEYA